MKTDRRVTWAVAAALLIGTMLCLWWALQGVWLGVVAAEAPPVVLRLLAAACFALAGIMVLRK